MSQRSLVPLLFLAALVPVALSLQAKTSVAPTAVPLPTEAAPAEAITRSRAPREKAETPGTLAASLVDHPPADARSKAPTAEEFRAEDALNVDGESRCTAFRVREWVRLRCAIERTQQIALLGGARDGVSFSIRRGASTDWWGGTSDEIVLPLRRGDHRVISVTTAEMGRYSAGGPASEVLISEHWLEGDTPVIVVQ